MWHWPRSWLPKGYKQFWFKLILVSLLGHLIMLFFGFFYHGRDNIKLTVFSQKRLVEVVVMPLYKKIPNAQKVLNQASKTSLKKTLVVPKPAIPKQVTQKIPVKKLAAPSQMAKPEPAPVKKKLTKKEIAKVVPQKTNQIKLSEPEAKNETAQQVVAAELDEPIYIGRHDLKNLQIAQELEAVVVKSWQPPLGFGSDIECTVELMVDKSGKVTNFVIKKSSNIMVYDMSVKRIFTQIVMPVGVRNKTLTIVFKQ